MWNACATDTNVLCLVAKVQTCYKRGNEEGACFCHMQSIKKKVAYGLMANLLLITLFSPHCSQDSECSNGSIPHKLTCQQAHRWVLKVCKLHAEEKQ